MNTRIILCLIEVVVMEKEDVYCRVVIQQVTIFICEHPKVMEHTEVVSY